MRETLINADGLGIAAPQIGVLRRVALIVDTCVESDDNDDKIIELINPQLISMDGEISASEGCLSVPGVYAVVTRPESVKIKAYDRYGKAMELEASEMTARAVCHEIDHLNGVVFTSIAERLLTDEEIEEMRRAREAGDCVEKEKDK